MKKRKTKKWPLVVILLLICLVFGILYLFNDYFEKNSEDNNPDVLEKDEPESKEYSLTFTLAGNVLINSNMWYDTTASDSTHDFEPIFKNLNEIKKSNVNFYFQQSIIGGKDLGQSLNYKYNSPFEVVDSMAKLGFNAMSIASYHSYDKGLVGIQNSINYLNDKKIAYSGVNDNESDVNKNNIITKNGLKIGLLSYTISTDEVVAESYAVNIYSDEKVKSDVELLKKNVDVIMVTIDWSNIQSTEVTEEQKRIANYLSELGVNIVVGNTSYTIQPIEIINETLVCYSLGNLLSGHVAVDSRISTIVDFKLIVNKSVGKKSVSFDDINVLFAYAYNNYNASYMVVPFTKISNELANYQVYYEKYNSMLTNYSDKVNVYPLGE